MTGVQTCALPIWQQQFLRMVRELRVRVAAVDYEEALFGPWTGASRLPSLSWDASAVRVYAHRASDPSKQKRGSIAAANWLAFVGLMFIPVAAHHGRLLTACTAGSWKHGSFRWPIWTGAATEAAARSLLQSPLPADAAARRARGIEVVFESTISRSDPGGSGAFSPASPL